MATIYIETHGCQMNEADSQYIVRRATAAGYTLTERADDASVLVLNTCTVRDNAEQRAYGRLSHWRAIKQADPTVKVVVAGCLAEQDRERMPGAGSHIDGVFGTRELRALGDQLEAWRPEFGDDDALGEREIETLIGGQRV
jgi:tRNA-2-methylthio-N6-dimethylallyladenosine synthase